MEVGEAFVGAGRDAAHVNTVVGERDGPVGTAWATALATPTAGHAPFLAVLQPGVPVKPFTLFVNKATVAESGHARMTWGPAQAGIAAGVADAVRDGTVRGDALDELLIVAAVWVDPAAADADTVFTNNREAVWTALEAGAHRLPPADRLLAVGDAVWNPFFRAP